MNSLQSVRTISLYDDLQVIGLKSRPYLPVDNLGKGGFIIDRKTQTLKIDNTSLNLSGKKGFFELFTTVLENGTITLADLKQLSLKQSNKAVTLLNWYFNRIGFTLNPVEKKKDKFQLQQIPKLQFEQNSKSLVYEGKEVLLSENGAKVLTALLKRVNRSISREPLYKEVTGQLPSSPDELKQVDHWMEELQSGLRKLDQSFANFLVKTVRVINNPPKKSMKVTHISNDGFSIVTYLQRDELSLSESGLFQEITNRLPSSPREQKKAKKWKDELSQYFTEESNSCEVENVYWKFQVPEEQVHFTHQ